jgi:hypothetical protein
LYLLIVVRPLSPIAEMIAALEQSGVTLDQFLAA